MFTRKIIILLVIILQILLLIPFSIFSVRGNGNLIERQDSLTQQDRSILEFNQNSSDINWDFSTYYGGTAEDTLTDMELDFDNNIIISAYTNSYNLPVANAYQENLGGNFDAYIAKFDPTGQSLIFASFLGGYDFDAAVDITIDSENNIYLTGLAYSLNFPTENALSSSKNGACDAFVAKFDPSGSVIFSTFLGGSGEDFCYGVECDSNDNLILTGHTGSSNFPTTPNAYDSTFAGEEDGFLTILNTTSQTIEYSSYLGGSGVDMGLKGFINNDDEIVIAGLTSSSDFDVTVNALQSTFAGDFDAFISIFSSTGETMLYSTYYGGDGEEIVQGIAEDSQGNLIAVGRTTASGLPLSINPLENQHGGVEDGYILKLNHQDYSLNFSTYLGGSEYDFVFDLIIDKQDNIVIFGTTASPEFTVTSNAYQTTLGGGNDAFLAILPPTGDSLLYSTFIGGESDDKGKFISSDDQGNIIIAGFTESTNFPTLNAYQSDLTSGTDGFIGKFTFGNQTNEASLFNFELLVLSTLFLALFYGINKKRN